MDETYTVYIDSDNFNWNETYYWRVRSIMDCDGCEYGDWIGTSMFSISQSTPPYIDEGIEFEPSTDIYQDDLLEDGYVAIGAFSPGPHSFIIDKYGNEIWNDGILLENEGWFSDGFILNHINEYGTMHTDAIITKNKNNAKIFLNDVKSSIAVHNASTQFADGGELGFGGEVGISTNKLPPRGPVGLNQLVSYKYQITSKGKIRK